MNKHKLRDFLKTSVAFAAGGFAPRVSLTFHLLVGTACGCIPARADDLADCTQPGDMPRVIAGCTSLLAAPERPAQHLRLRTETGAPPMRRWVTSSAPSRIIITLSP